MPIARATVTAAALAAALAVPAVAAAKSPSGHGAGHAKVQRAGERQDTAQAKRGGQSKGRGHRVTYQLRGTWSGGALQVTGGNSAARRAGLVGTTVALELGDAKVKVADVDGNGVRDAADLRDGDRLSVQVRVARGTDLDAPLAARLVVARSGAQTEADDADSADSADSADDGSAAGDDPAGDDGAAGEDTSAEGSSRGTSGRSGHGKHGDAGEDAAV